MRGDVIFRESSKSYIQFANEIYIYSTVLPYYDKFLKKMKVKDINILDLVPRIFKAKFGYIQGIIVNVKVSYFLNIFHCFERLKLDAF